MERLVAGRDRTYLDRFWNEFSANPKRFGDAARDTTRSSMPRRRFVNIRRRLALGVARLAA
jgi:hypothetical protein